MNETHTKKTPSLDLLLPHKPPMRLIDELVSADANGAQAMARLPSDSLFAETNGRIALEILPELVAQTFAAGVGYAAQKMGKGYLAAIRNAEFFAEPHVGDTLHIKAQRTNHIGEVVIVTGEVRRSDLLLARLELKIFLLPEQK